MLYVTGIFISVCVKHTGAVACNSQWQEYMEKCYLRFNEHLAWKSGMLTCMRYNQLITIDNDGLNTFIQQNITNGSDVWLGLTNGNVSRISEWTWSDGQSVTYTDDWDGNPVNSFCVTMVLTGDEKIPPWNTRLCTSNYSFVCEKDMVNTTCDETWLEYEMHCYFIVLETGSKMNNMVAARYCWDQQAYIVSINNQSEAEFLYRNLQTGTEYWIGLSPLKWLDGTPLQWNNWDELGPDKDSSCVYMDHLTGIWYSGSCDGRRRFVCQDDIPDSTTMSHMSTQFSSPSKSKDITIQDYDETTMHDYNTSIDEALPKTFLLTVVTPAVTGCIIIIIIVIITVVLIVIRRQRSSKSPSKDSEQEKQTKSIHDTTIDVYETVEPIEHTHHQSVTKCSTAAHGHEEMVRGPDDTVVVNGDVYAIVDPEKKNPVFIKDAAKSNNIGKLDIAKGQGHMMIGSDVYAIVDTDRVVPNEPQKPKQKKKKPSPPPKLEDNSDELISDGHNHIVVGSDVYTVVDKDKEVPNEPQKPEQKKKKPSQPSKLEDNSDELISNGHNHIVFGPDVYTVVDKDKEVPNEPQKLKQKKKKPSPPTQLEDKSDIVNPNSQSHTVVASDVYAIVDTEKITPSKQQKPKQKKRNHPTPLKLKDKSDDLNDGNVYYNEFNMDTAPATTAKHKGKQAKQTENIGVVYADLDLTGSLGGNGQGGGNEENSGVVYADVRS